MSSHEAGEQEWLSRADIALRSTSASTAIERRRWQVIGLLADGAPLAEIVARTGCRPRTIRQIAQRYRECGPAGLADGGSAAWAQRPSSRRASSVISARRSGIQRQTAGSGQAQKSRGGLRPGLESACIANAAGSICGG